MTRTQRYYQKHRLRINTLRRSTPLSPKERERQRRKSREWKLANPELHRQQRDDSAARKAGYKDAAERKALKQARVAERERASEQKKARRVAEREAVLKARPWLRSELTASERWKLRYALDPDFNLGERLRAADRKKKLGPYVKAGDNVRQALIRNGKVGDAWERRLGWTVAELRRHIERQFRGKMSWGAFCDGSIHLDHIVPLKLFDLTNETEARAAWALSNLRPLWAKANLEKAAERTLLL